MSAPVLDGTTLVVRRVATHSHPWGIVHEPSGRVVEVVVESEVRPGFFHPAAYHRRKRDATAALARFLASRAGG